MSTFAQLKKSNDNLSRLLTEVDKVNQPQQSSNSNNDDRLKSVQNLISSCNVYAVIRFLPESEVKNFLVPHLQSCLRSDCKYIENSLTTLNQKDPQQSITLSLGTPAQKQTKK